MIEVTTAMSGNLRITFTWSNGCAPAHRSFQLLLLNDKSIADDLPEGSVFKAHRDGPTLPMTTVSI
jgi:hypothetical protein